MYRLLIVDDEPIITDGLFDILNDDQNLELDIYRAYSGHEALARMQKTKIDILLTDIDMPGINGLEVQKEVLLQWPDCRIIFLTGYNEFAYIQTALRNQSTDYILKTESRQAVVQAVQKAVREIDRQIESKRLEDRANESIRRVLPILQERFLLDIVEGASDDQQEIARQLQDLQIKLEPDIPLLLMLGRVDSWPVKQNLLTKSKILYGIQSIAAEHMSNLAAATSLILDRNSLLWLIQPAHQVFKVSIADNALQTLNRTVHYVHGVMDSVQASCKQLYDLSVSFAVTSEPVPWEQIPLCLDTLKSTLEKAAGFSSEMLLIAYPSELSEDAARSAVDTEDLFFVRQKLKRVRLLKTLLENYRRTEFFELYDEIMQVGTARQPSGINLRKELYYSLSALFLSHMNKASITEIISAKVDLRKITVLETQMPWAQVTQYFRHLADAIFDQKQADNFRNANRMFGFIKSYAEQHLQDDLSLSKFAELLHFHPSYLSRLFKQVTGKSLSEYIWQVKLEKAKELLKQNELKINEISLALGFETPSYFTRFFRKRENLTPQEYRNLQTNIAIDGKQ